MNAESFFSSAEKERVQRAVIAAEKTTSGEIVPMLVSKSGHYAEVDLAGLCVGLVLGTLAALIWQDPWASIHSQLFWPLGGAALGLITCSIPQIKRLFLSSERITEAVHMHSLAAFTGHGLHHTKDHTGILLFVSLLEHRVVVLADRGVNEKVEAGSWDEVVRIMTEGLRARDACGAFCKAIERCGEILARHFPRSPDDKDELADKLITER
jgi:putative membrane protein